MKYSFYFSGYEAVQSERRADSHLCGRRHLEKHGTNMSNLLFFHPSIEPAKSSIAPFRGLKRPLQFLGLFETSLCRLTHIPAYKVRRLQEYWQ